MKPIKRSSLKHYNNITSGDEEGGAEGHDYLERYQDDFINGSKINHNDGEIHHATIVRESDDDGENRRLLAELKSEIQFWNKFLVIGNSILIFICIIILIVELTTDVLVDHSEGDDIFKTLDKTTFAVPEECLNHNTFAKENNVGSFFACANYCSGGSKSIIVNSTTNGLTHNLSSESVSSSSSIMPTICSGGLNDNSETMEICNEICEPMLSSDLEHFQAYISSVCDEEKINVGNDNVNGSEEMQLCAKECSPFDCCFSLDDDINCFEEKEVVCGAFFDTCLKVHENAAMFGAGLGPQILGEGDRH